MTQPDNETVPTNSPLNQSVTRDGKTVQVEIYENGEGGWLLEVVDEYGNSTVWDASFGSDREALDEAFNTIDEEGIDSLIGSPADALAATKEELPLSNAELEELDDFLAGDEDNWETSMDVSTLDGFLTAIAIGPRIVFPSEWMPWVWDMEAGEVGSPFKDAAQAGRIMSLVMRHYNSVIDAFHTDPASCKPIFWRDVCWGAAEWCEGFLLGFQFHQDDWSLLAVEQPAWFAPFLRLGTDDGIAITAIECNADKWMNEIEPSLIKIHAYWQDFTDTEVETVVRSGPKIGRNDPCPCGSGKKFKKCCGANGAPTTLH